MLRLFRTGDDGYSGRQGEGYSGSYGYKDGPPRRDYDRADAEDRSSSRMTGLLSYCWKLLWTGMSVFFSEEEYSFIQLY